MNSILIYEDTNDEFEGIEDYKNGDSFSKIAWKNQSLKIKNILKSLKNQKKK